MVNPNDLIEHFSEVGPRGYDIIKAKHNALKCVAFALEGHSPEELKELRQNIIKF